MLRTRPAERRRLAPMAAARASESALAAWARGLLLPRRHGGFVPRPDARRRKRVDAANRSCQSAYNRSDQAGVANFSALSRAVSSAGQASILCVAPKAAATAFRRVFPSSGRLATNSRCARRCAIFGLARGRGQAGSDQIEGKVVEQRAVIEQMAALHAEAVAGEFSHAGGRIGNGQIAGAAKNDARRQGAESRRRSMPSTKP